jgi:hypothetical protein
MNLEFTATAQKKGKDRIVSDRSIRIVGGKQKELCPPIAERGWSTGIAAQACAPRIMPLRRIQSPGEWERELDDSISIRNDRSSQGD